MKQLNVKFITVEGIEGVGKSTCIAYISKYLMQKKIPLCVTREPGGTPIAEQIRQILLTRHTEIMADDTELLLMFASRAQHLTRVIKPALAAGKWVLCDRFTDASYAYQGGGRGVALERIAILETWVQHDLRPDLTLLLDAPVEQALMRMKHRAHPDRIEAEQQQFFQRVRDTYLLRAAKSPERYRVIDASVPLEKVELQIQQWLETL